MTIRLKSLVVRTRKAREIIEFATTVTVLHGPVGTGKSTVARLIDYCLGGSLERTPAIQQEFLAAELSLYLGEYDCVIERAAADAGSVRVTWTHPSGSAESISAPLAAQAEPLIDAPVYSLSDLVFYLCGVEPIKVRRSRADRDSPLVRLSIRDVWWYCYLNQTHLDSSFFRFEDPFRRRKSQDAMRFFSGLYSERLSELETEVFGAVEEQRGKREAVRQIRDFMARFDLGSESDIARQLQQAEDKLRFTRAQRETLDRTRQSEAHPTDRLRGTLRELSGEVEALQQAMSETEELIREQRALRAELITAKAKANRATRAGVVLEGVSYVRCPECGSDLSGRADHSDGLCRLCSSSTVDRPSPSTVELEMLQRDLDDRIDEIADSIGRRKEALARTRRELARMLARKRELDARLETEMSRYDSAFVESIREAEREAATLEERIRSLQRLQQMPQAAAELEETAGALQGRIDRLRSEVDGERQRLRGADQNVQAIAAEFRRLMLAVRFPGVSGEDDVVLDPRSWRPTVVHGEQEWSFWDTGSGGKKTLFNVCFALAVHAIAVRRELPVPSIIIVDSPTKNISEDENPELVKGLYSEIYRLAQEFAGGLQCLLIDSELVSPSEELSGFLERRMAGELNAPSLISYYDGP